MRVFVTGASGWVGSALVPELIEAGHHVVGLARSDASAEHLVAAGAEVQRGTLEDLGSLRAATDKADGVVHLAFIHDFDRYEAANETDRRAITAMGAVLKGSDRPLVIASGVATTAVGRPATEVDPPAPGFARSEASNVTVALAEKGVRSSVVRLPPTVHGRGDNGFIAWLVTIAREKGVVGYIAAGTNVWPAVYRADAARVFRLALEDAPPGSVWHAVGEDGVRTRTIAETMARHLDLPLAAIAPQDASAHFGFLGLIWGSDLPTSSVRTQETLGWHPMGPGLIDDLEEGHYFAGPDPAG